MANDGWRVGVRLHQLEGFFHVTQHQGYTRAARAMPYPITEPALHQQVRKLESALGVKLLERAPGRRMLPTPEGRALYDFVAPHFSGLPHLLRQLVEGELASLVVASEPLYTEDLCAAALGRLHEALPRVRLRLLELDEPDLFARLRSGEVDVGLANVVGAPPEGLSFEPLGELGVELVVPAGHPLGKRRSLGWKQLDGLVCVAYERGSRGRGYMDRCLSEAGLAVDPMAEASSASGLRALVRAGVAPAFVPALLGRKKRPKRRTSADGSVTFDLTALMREAQGELPPFGVIRRATLRPHQLVRDFTDALQTELG
jgi:DNA-binding transcriptional LysR family regulator